ncbi:MAG: patatin-like phospholipase family protein [Oligoflexia bacterium]|nr:patatin-like phospholipase family protein [Oligoflexia bacterium]
MKLNLEKIASKRIALVLSGGVVKAATWHLGVALALEELGFTFEKINDSLGDCEKKKESKLNIETCVGSSSGSLIGLFLSCGYKPSEIISSSFGGDLPMPIEEIVSLLSSSPATSKAQKRFKKLTYKDIMSFRRPIKKPPESKIYKPFANFPFFLQKLLKPLINISGIFSTVGISNHLKKYVLSENSTFNDFNIDLFIVASRLDYSGKVIFSKYNYPSPNNDPMASFYTGVHPADAVAASMSVPPIYSPYPIKNLYNGRTDYFIDGDIRDTLSHHVALDHQCEVIISSWTHTPYHYHDEIGSLINYGLPAICVQAIYLMLQKKILNTKHEAQKANNVIENVHQYMKDQKFSSEHIKNIISIIENQLHHKRDNIFIDIHPSHDNYELFFSSFFSLDSEHSVAAIKMGYDKTMEVLRNHFKQDLVGPSLG